MSGGERNERPAMGDRTAKQILANLQNPARPTRALPGLAVTEAASAHVALENRPVDADRPARLL